MTADNTAAEKPLICPWCNEVIIRHDLTAIVDGETMHITCAAEDEDNAFFDRDMGFEDR